MRPVIITILLAAAAIITTMLMMDRARAYHELYPPCAWSPVSEDLQCEASVAAMRMSGRAY